MNFGLDMGPVGLIVTTLLFWVGLIALAIWLVGLLFPAAKKQGDDNSAPLSPPEVCKIGQAQGELAGEQPEQQ